MNSVERLVIKYYRLRSSWWRRKRLLFPSPAEMRLIELMGGKVIRLQPVKATNGFPLVLYIKPGNLFKQERVRREVRVGKFYLDFGNDIGRGIEVDGDPYHMDVVADFDREIYMQARQWRILRIRASDLWRNPDVVQRKVLKFLID